MSTYKQKAAELATWMTVYLTQVAQGQAMLQTTDPQTKKQLLQQQLEELQEKNRKLEEERQARITAHANQKPQ